MATKKYLSLEEAAGILKIKPDELIRLREKGDVRGFADRGTWKFKAEDVEELHRRRQPDSNPEVPLMDDDDDLGRQPTIISKGRGSDSDVRLVPDDKLRSKLTGSSAEIPVMGDSDSDVRLTSAKAGALRSSDSDVQLVSPRGPDSDSDVQLADSDSDVRLTDSNSDVRLAPPHSSDSDVKLVERGKKTKSSDSDVALLPRGGKSPRKDSIDFDDPLVSGSDSVLLEDSGMALAADSGIRLDAGSNLSFPGDSGILLEGAGESGFPLRGDSATMAESSDSDISIEDDSGITLEGDSGIHLSGDSGIRLDVDSGIKLDAGDSGIRLSDGPRSGKTKKKPKDDLDSSVPMLLSDEAHRTDIDVPMIEDDSELETLNLPSKPKKKSKGDTSVVIFEEDDSGSGLGEGSDNFGDSDLDGDDELEVADDILGEDDDMEQLEVFDSDDSVFDESFVQGGSSVAIPAYSGKIHVAPEVEWGSGTMALLICSTIVLSLGVILSVDLLRIVWGSGAPNVYPGELIGLFGAMFK